MKSQNQLIRQGILEAASSLDQTQLSAKQPPSFTYVPPTHARALDPEVAATIDRELRALGYAHVTIDLRGYRLGSLNDALKLRQVE